MKTNLQEEQQADYQVFEAKGTHYQIGMETARYAGKQSNPKVECTVDQLHFAEKCRNVVELHYPEMIEEFKGYADGLKISEEDLVWHYTLGVTGACSGIAIRTPNGMFIGRNYDYFYWENKRHLIATRPNKGFSHIGMHEGLVGGRFDGLNQKGVFVSFNGAGEHPNPAVAGISFHLIVRYVLEKCSDAIEAREALMNLPVKEPKSYLVADSKEAFVVEIHPEHRAVRKLEGDLLIMTNHFKHPSMRQYQGEWPNSVARYGKLKEQAARMKTAPFLDPLEIIKRGLTDHEAPVCGHIDGLATFWSCLVDLEKNKIFYSLGAPCRNEYKEYFTF